MAFARFDISVLGDKGLGHALRKLPGELQGKALATPLRKGAMIVKEASEALIPVHTGKLKSVGLKVRKLGGKKNKDKLVYAIVTPKRDQLGVPAGTKSNPAVHLELGTADRPAHPYMRHGMDSSRQRAIAVIKTELGKSITRAARRLAKKKGGK